jgi:GTP cyclohydrolase I
MSAMMAVERLLTFVGEDTAREGLRETPRRVIDAWLEMTSGYEVDVAELLAVQFDEQSDELVLVKGIEFTSLCEHHVLPFVGTATVGYIPRHGVVGLSKLARLVDVYARRLQVQERMTRQIADAIDAHLSPLGVGVVLRAQAERGHGDVVDAGLSAERALSASRVPRSRRPPLKPPLRIRASSQVSAPI